LSNSILVNLRISFKLVIRLFCRTNHSYISRITLHNPKPAAQTTHYKRPASPQIRHHPLKHRHSPGIRQSSRERNAQTPNIIPISVLYHFSCASNMSIKPAVMEMIPPMSVSKRLWKLSSRGLVRSMTPGIAVIIEMHT
jgi:hypothetical protein